VIVILNINLKINAEHLEPIIITHRVKSIYNEWIS